MAEHLVALAGSLPLADAERIVAAALATQRARGLLPLAEAVLDAGGDLVACKREEGCETLRGDIGFGKAWGAPASVSGGRFIPVPGGVLALDASGVAVCALGISGDASDKDEYCAISALHAAGYDCEPEQPAPGWDSAGL